MIKRQGFQTLIANLSMKSDVVCPHECDLVTFSEKKTTQKGKNLELRTIGKHLEQFRTIGKHFRMTPKHTVIRD